MNQMRLNLRQKRGQQREGRQAVQIHDEIRSCYYRVKCFGKVIFRTESEFD